MVKFLILFICVFFKFGVNAGCQVEDYTDFYVLVNNQNEAANYQEKGDYKLHKTSQEIPNDTPVRLIHKVVNEKFIKKSNKIDKEEVLIPNCLTSPQYIKYCLLGTSIISIISIFLIIRINRKKDCK